MNRCDVESNARGDATWGRLLSPSPPPGENQATRDHHISHISHAQDTPLHTPLPSTQGDETLCLSTKPWATTIWPISFIFVPRGGVPLVSARRTESSGELFSSITHTTPAHAPPPPPPHSDVRATHTTSRSSKTRTTTSHASPFAPCIPPCPSTPNSTPPPHDLNMMVKILNMKTQRTLPTHPTRNAAPARALAALCRPLCCIRQRGACEQPSPHSPTRGRRRAP